MKKLLTLLLALCLMAAPCALAQEEALTDEDGLALINPVHSVQSLEELAGAVPGAALPALPEDVQTVLYSYIDGEPTVAQIQFYWGEDFYTLRAAALPEDGVALDIDGVYLVFDEIEEFTNLYEGDEDRLMVKSSSEEPYAVADWTRADLGAQYSLFTESGGEPEMPIVQLAAMLMAHESDWVTADE